MMNQFKNPTFGGFKPEAMQRIANSLGYSGDMSGFQSYLNNNPDKQNQMNQYNQTAMAMARGGVVQKFNQGGSAAALKLLKQGDTAGAMSMMKSNVGLDSKLTSNDALQYMQKTGDQSGAEQILQSSVGLPTGTSTNTTTGSNITGNTQPFNQNQQQTLGTYNTGQPQATTQPQTAEMQQFNNQMQSNVAGANAGTTQPQSTPQPQEQTAEMQQFNQQMQGAVSGTTQPQSTIAAVAADQPTGDQQMQKAMAEQQTETEKQLEQTAKSLVDQQQPDISDELKQSIQNRQDAFANSDIAKAAQAAQEKIFQDALAQAGLSGTPQTQEESDKLNAILQPMLEASPEIKALQNAQASLGKEIDAEIAIENINTMYPQKEAEYERLNLQLQMLQQEAANDPENEDLKKSVEELGKKVSDSFTTLQQLKPIYDKRQTTIEDVMADRATDPTLPEGAKVSPEKIAEDTDQFIKDTSGQVTGDIAPTAETADVSTAEGVTQPDTAKYEADVSAEKVAAQTASLNAAKIDPNDPRAKVTAAQTTKSAVSDLSAAQGTAHQFDNEIQRELDDGELVSGSAVDAVKAAKFTEQIQAAEATPTEKATVQGQLDGLMQDFEGGKTPAWAAGAMRAATAAMAARGLGASSMAGQAIVQAAMESALPIAQADAATQASFEAQNLSNRQARAMLAAEQRAAFMKQDFDQEFQTRVINAAKISDIANMNFTADQQVQLENARFAQTMNIENLSARQGMVLAEAAALSSLDLANLNNRQQAAVQNASNFLQMSMLNTTNEQQTEIFKAQQNINAMLTDSAATNAAAQFNASSENQANQFYDNLTQTLNTFNATQKNMIEQFNVGQENAFSQFIAEMKNQREQFNAQNQLVIDQSNATWRREIATADTAAINRANELNAINTLDISNSAYNNLWNMFGDQMEWAINSYESEADRISAYNLELLRQDGSEKAAKYAADRAASAAIGGAIISFLTAGSDTILGGLFN